MCKKQPIAVTVTRGKWLRGTGLTSSYLRRADDGKKCCIGFLCGVLGMTDAEITGHKHIREVMSHAELCEALGVDVRTFGDAYILNDDSYLSDGEREARLTTWGLANNIAFTFVD